MYICIDVFAARIQYKSVTIEFSNMKGNIDTAEATKQEDIARFTLMLEANIKALEEERKDANNLALDECFLQVI